MTPIDGYYINLDRSPERRASMEAELAAKNLSFVQRFPAVDGRARPRPAACAIPPAAYGSFLSHYEIIRQSAPDSCTLIFEDDMTISANLAGTLSPENLPSFLEYDLVFLDCQPGIDLQTPWLYYQATRAMRNLDNAALSADERRQATTVAVFAASGFYRWGAAAYLVTPRGKAKLGDLLQRTLERGPPGTLDIDFRNLIESGAIDAVMLLPFLATPDIRGMCESTIEGREQANLPFVLLSAIRRLFYAGDIDGIRAWVNTVLPIDLPEDDQGLMAELLRQISIGLSRDENFLTLGP